MSSGSEGSGGPRGGVGDEYGVSSSFGFAFCFYIAKSLAAGFSKAVRRMYDLSNSWMLCLVCAR